jgi:hypothetical protein
MYPPAPRVETARLVVAVAKAPGVSVPRPTFVFEITKEKAPIVYMY